MPKRKKGIDKQQQDVEWLQSELKRARLFNTTSHSTIVDLQRKLKQQKEDFQRKLLASRDMNTHTHLGQQTNVSSFEVHQGQEGGSLSHIQEENQRLKIQLKEQEEKNKEAQSQMHNLTLRNTDLSSQCDLLKIDLKFAKQCSPSTLLQQRFSSLTENHGMLQGHYNSLQGCFRRMLQLANSTLKVTDTSDNVAQEGAGCIMEYLRLVNRREGMSASLDEIRRELPSKYMKNTGFGKRVKGMLFEYHPDKHTGSGRWNMAVCEGVTKFLNSLRS